MLGAIIMKKLYLDVCTLCRPFDDQNIMRNRMEAAAFFLIMQNICSKRYELIISPVHELEVSDIKEINERKELIELFNRFGVRPPYNRRELRKRVFIKYGNC